MESLNPDYADSNGANELRRNASLFKAMAENPLNDKMVQDKSKEWLDCHESDPGNKRHLRALQIEINIFGKAVVAANQAEVELRDDMERARAKNFGT